MPQGQATPPPPPQVDYNNNVTTRPPHSNEDERRVERPMTGRADYFAMSYRFQYPLPYGTLQFNMFKNMFYQSMGYQYQNVIDITRIDAIDNQTLQYNYEYRKQEMSNFGPVEESIFFHNGNVSPCERDSIARYNFKPVSGRMRTVFKEPAVLFARSVKDAMSKSRHIVYAVKVLQSKVYLDSGLAIPPNVDTVYDLSGKFVLKFNDAEYYPLCAIYFNINEHDF